MAGDGECLGEKIKALPGYEEDSELDHVANGWNRMSKDFDIFGHTVLLARPIATSLSQKITVAGWGWPRSARIFRSSTTIRAAAKRPPYSASTTNEQTTGMRVEWVEMGWLMGPSARKVIAGLPM